MRTSRRASNPPGIPTSPLFAVLWIIIAAIVFSACAVQPRAQSPDPQSSTGEARGDSTICDGSSCLAHTQTPNSTQSPDPRLPNPCLPSTGSIKIREIESEVLGRTMTARVYLPACYDPQREEGYPVLYLLHGQSADDSLWDTLGMDETADHLIRAEIIPPLIMVFPREDYYLQETSESEFPAAVLETLIPWVDETYNTCPQRACRAIGGISRGAYWAVKFGFLNWDQFSSIGAHSLPGAPFSSYRLRDLYKAMPVGQRPRFYFDIGKSDIYINPANRFENLLNEYKIPHERVLSDGGHDAVYWKEHLEEYLKWYSQGWQ